MAWRRSKTGPDSLRVAARLRTEIESGRFPTGQFMPCTRDLGKEYKVSPETVRRAMKTLEAEGLIIAEPRHGFQVLSRPEERKMTTIAYVLTPDKPGTWEGFSGQILSVFQRVAARHGYSLLAIAADGTGSDHVPEHIRETSAVGVILNTPSTDLFEAVERLGLPTITAEVWSPANRFDAIVQDSFGGAMQAAEHLARLGHKRIGWIGPTTESIQAIERWGGAVAGLRTHGLTIPPERVVDGADSRDPGPVQALLSRPDRPTGLICLWGSMAIGAVRAAAQLGLRPGRDLDVVGWGTDEHFENYAAAFPDGQVPATVTWRVESLAEATLARLAERRAKPDLPKVRVNIETRLRAAVQ